MSRLAKHSERPPLLKMMVPSRVAPWGEIGFDRCKDGGVVGPLATGSDWKWCSFQLISFYLPVWLSSEAAGIHWKMDWWRFVSPWGTPKACWSSFAYYDILRLPCWQVWVDITHRTPCRHVKRSPMIRYVHSLSDGKSVWKGENHV
jgi:hypothetical protein